MESITIDRLPARIHERYAQDQQYVDAAYHTEPSQVAPHAEGMAGFFPIYASQLDALFHKEPTYIPWAFFSPPPFFRLKRKKHFAGTLIAGMGIHPEILDIETDAFSIHAEKQRLALFALFEEMDRINKMLHQIEGEKMRYQKG